MSLPFDADAPALLRPLEPHAVVAGRSASDALGGPLKRIVDVAGAILAILLLSPLLLMVFVLVKSSGEGPALFAHRRVGRHGRPFYCLKFRTMVSNSELALQRHLACDAEAAAEWRATRKLKNDPRITPVGVALRKTSLDELPQLVNILRGEMSFVGPRPVVEDEIELYGANRAYYLAARPGLTGLWQVSGRNDVSYDERVLLDRRYVETWSFWTDVKIVVKTIPAVMASRGTY